MPSASAAHSETCHLCDLLAPNKPVKVQLEAVYREVGKRLPNLTRRRVRAFFFAEAKRADYEEVCVLKEVRAEQELKRARLQLAANANVLAAHHAATGAPLDSDTVDALGRLARYLDLSGDAA